MYINLNLSLDLHPDFSRSNFSIAKTNSPIALKWKMNIFVWTSDLKCATNFDFHHDLDLDKTRNISIEREAADVSGIKQIVNGVTSNVNMPLTHLVIPSQQSYGGYIGFTLSVCLSVCPSVCLSVNLSCPPCSIYSSGWILSIFGTNDQ